MAGGNQFMQVIEARAAEVGDKPFIIGVAGERISYRAFADLAKRAAGGLLALGLVPGDRVGLLLPNAIEFVALWYAGQLAGVTLVPLNPQLGAEGLGYMLDHAAPALIVAGAEAARQLPAGRYRVVTLADGATAAQRLAPVLGPPIERAAPMGGEHPAQYIYTSGTTGRPKAAPQSAGLLADVAAICRRVGLTGDDVLYTFAPLCHGLAQTWIQFAMQLGATVVLRERFSVQRFWPEVREYGCTATQHVGAILSFLLRQPPRPDDRDHPLRLSFGVGAETALWTAFEARFGVEIVEFYGMTEVGLIAYNDRPARPGSLGLPSGRFDIRLVDDAEREVPPGAVGEAWLRPVVPGVRLPEYYRDPAGTAASRAGEWFRTGDLVRFDADGYLFFVGRSKESLRRRGENIVPDDIERVAERHPDVAAAAAAAVPSEHGEDEIKLCLVLKPGREPDPAGLSGFLAAELPVFMRPRYLDYRAELPYTATSKLQRRSLRGLTDRVWDVERGDWLDPAARATL